MVRGGDMNTEQLAELDTLLMQIGIIFPLVIGILYWLYLQI